MSVGGKILLPGVSAAAAAALACSHTAHVCTSGDPCSMTMLFSLTRVAMWQWSFCERRVTCRKGLKGRLEHAAVNHMLSNKGYQEAVKRPKLAMATQLLQSLPNPRGPQHFVVVSWRFLQSVRRREGAQDPCLKQQDFLSVLLSHLLCCLPSSCAAFPAPVLPPWLMCSSPSAGCWRTP